MQPTWQKQTWMNPQLEKKNLYIKGQPIVKVYSPVTSFQDNFQFPAW